MYRKIVSLKRFQTFILILGISAGCFCPPLMAQERNAWQFGYPPANSSGSKPDDQQVYQVLLKMLDRWNAHDIEGYMQSYWRSPELLVVVASEQFNGWQQLHNSYVNGCPVATANGVHPAQTHPSQVVEAGSGIGPYFVVGLFSKLQAGSSGEQHNESPKI